VAKENQESF